MSSHTMHRPTPQHGITAFSEEHEADNATGLHPMPPPVSNPPHYHPPHQGGGMVDYNVVQDQAINMLRKEISLLRTEVSAIKTTMEWLKTRVIILCTVSGLGGVGLKSTFDQLWKDPPPITSQQQPLPQQPIQQPPQIPTPQQPPQNVPYQPYPPITPGSNPPPTRN